MTMPTGFTGSVYLGTEYGSVDTNLNIKEKSRANYEFATGKLGSGKGVINIETKSSNIDLTEE